MRPNGPLACALNCKSDAKGAMAVLAVCEVGLRLRTRCLLSAIEAMLFGARPEHVKAHECSDDQDNEKEEAESPDDGNLSLCPLPCLPLMVELNLKHQAKFLRFLLAETIGPQGFFLAHRI